MNEELSVELVNESTPAKKKKSKNIGNIVTLLLAALLVLLFFNGIMSSMRIDEFGKGQATLGLYVKMLAAIPLTVALFSLTVSIGLEKKREKFSQSIVLAILSYAIFSANLWIGIFLALA